MHKNKIKKFIELDKKKFLSHSCFNSLSLKTPMKRDCVISIIIPCYNEQENIRECMYRLYQNQNKIDSTSIEVIFVNNNSKDFTKSIIENFIARRQLNNWFVVDEKIQGVLLARKRGYDEVIDRYQKRGLSKEHYFINLDVDTIIQPNWLKSYIFWIETKEFDMIFGDSKWDIDQFTNEDINKFLSMKWDIDTYFLHLFDYLYKISGNDSVIKLSSYIKCGGFYPYYCFVNDKFHLAVSDDWDISCNAWSKGMKILYKDNQKLSEFNLRKIRTALKEVIDSSLYGNNDLHNQEPQDVKLTKEQLKFLLESNFNGSIAFNFFMPIVANREFLQNSKIRKFLTIPLCEKIEKELFFLDQIYSKSNIDGSYWFVTSIFLLMKNYKEIYDRMKQLKIIKENVSFENTKKILNKYMNKDIQSDEYKMNMLIFQLCKKDEFEKIVSEF